VTSQQHPSPSLWSRIKRHRIPFLRTTTKKYTPLIFFTVPKGLSSTCDEMERIVCQIENECHVHVERLDVLRHPENEAVLNMVIQSIRTSSPTISTAGSTGSSSSSISSISNSLSSSSTNPSHQVQPQPPLLYHRESRQVYQVLPPNHPTSKSTSKTSTSPPPLYIDPERIRAWAKGRYLSPFIQADTHLVPPNLQTLSSSSSNPTIRYENENIDGLMDDDTTSNHHMEALLDEMVLSPEQMKGKRLMEERTKGRAVKTTTTATTSK
jgi:hypothetical protein